VQRFRKGKEKRESGSGRTFPPTPSGKEGLVEADKKEVGGGGKRIPSGGGRGQKERRPVLEIAEASFEGKGRMKAKEAWEDFAVKGR